MAKLIELVKALHRRKIDIACVQETKCMVAKARETNWYKLWHLSLSRGRYGVSILVEKA